MKYNVQDVNITVTEDETLVAGEKKIHIAEFEFDESWNEYTEIAVFKRGSVTVEQVLVDNKCEIPWEVLAKRGTLMVGVYGTTAEKIRPTLWAPNKTINDGAEPGEASREPTPDKWQQLLEALSKMEIGPETVAAAVEKYLSENPRPGENVEGRIFVPFTVDEENDCAYILEDEIEAQFGAEIFNDYDGNIATGLYASASGYGTQALGNYSKASGWWTRADAQCATAEGLLTRASGHFSHAEGTRTKATINNAHSEGDMTEATGRQSHAEGQGTVASGFCSHSEGSDTQATGYFSHAEGLGTIAAGRNQTAMGKYNVKDTTSLLIVGNGTKDSDRKNAFKLDASGNGTFAGKVTSNGTPTNDNDVITKKYLADNIAALIRDVLDDTAQAPKLGEVTLLADSWEGENSLYSQVVSVEGATEHSQVDLTPSVEQLAAFYEKDITFVTENEDGVVTVYAIGQKPTNDYTIQVTITEVAI